MRFRSNPQKGDGEEITHKYLFLDEPDGWLDAYRPGKLRANRVEMFTKMKVPPSNGAGGPGKATHKPAVEPAKRPRRRAKR